MNSYVALLRGIGPGNPNMRNDKLRSVFERLGFTNVRTVISSGNVLFDAASTDIPALEASVERALPEQLGFNSTTIIRSRAQLQTLVDHDPFKGVEGQGTASMNVTFIKTTPRTKINFPYEPPDKGYILLAMHGQDICTVTDLSRNKTPDLMSWLEREFGKAITTRTYNTVNRILKKFAQG